MVELYPTNSVDKETIKEIQKRIKSDKGIPLGLRNHLSLFNTLLFSYIIFLDDIPIGTIFGEIIEDIEDELFTSYYIIGEYRGNEYIEEGIKKMSEILYKNEGIKTLTFYVSKSNISSRKVMYKIKAEEEIESQFYLRV